MSELNEVDAVLFAIESSFGVSLDAVVDDDRVVIARAYQKLSRLGKSHRVDFVRILLEYLGYFEALNGGLCDPHPDFS